MMKQELLYEYGLNEQGQIIKAKDAHKGKKYICPGCKTDFILRKSGKTGPGSRIPHFAHNNLTDSCSFESYLHKTFILKTVEFLQELINKNLPLVVNWKCSLCQDKHTMNILHNISGVKAEYSMKERKPDITLYLSSGIVPAVIEVIYKHPPEKEALQFYRQHNIRVIQIKIASDNDLDNIEQKLINPTSFDLCITPRFRKIPLISVGRPRFRPSNGIPNDFLDNPGKYYSKNGKFYIKRRRWL